MFNIKTGQKLAHLTYFVQNDKGELVRETLRKLTVDRVYPNRDIIVRGEDTFAHVSRLSIVDVRWA